MQISGKRLESGEPTVTLESRTEPSVSLAGTASKSPDNSRDSGSPGEGVLTPTLTPIAVRKRSQLACPF